MGDARPKCLLQLQRVAAGVTPFQPAQWVGVGQLFALQILPARLDPGTYPWPITMWVRIPAFPIPH